MKIKEQRLDKGRKYSALDIIRNWAAIFAVAAALVIFTAARPSTFLTYNNIITILRSVAITTVLAMGLTVTLAVGGFDLGAGAMASITGYFIMSHLLWYGYNFWVSCLIALLVTMALTCVTMFLIIKCKVPDLLATCAMQFVLQGLGLTYTGGGAVSAGMARPNGEPSVGSIPNIMNEIGSNPIIIILIMVVCVAVCHILLNYTKYGRKIYATGGNKEAAQLSGIPVKRYRFMAGMISAVFIAIAGIMVVCRNSSAQIQGADGYQLPALAAVFIGRSVLGREKPNATGTLVGALLLGILDNGLIMVGVPYYTLPAIKGVVLALALLAAYATKKDT